MQQREQIAFEWVAGCSRCVAEWLEVYFWMCLGVALKKKAIASWMGMMATHYHIMRLKISSLVASYLIVNVLMTTPTASEANSAKTQVELTRNIWWWGNQMLANLLAPLIMKQKPREHTKLPR